MDFRTTLNLKKANFSITHSDKILTIGSCFAENIGNKLTENKFNSIINPFGILYNPISIENCINSLMGKHLFSEGNLIYHQEQWHSFFHHGSFSSSDKNLCLSSINEKLIQGHDFLKDADFLVITFGSAYVYAYKETRLVVSNCHKIPEKEFNQYLVSFDFLLKSWSKLLQRIKEFNPKIKLIFTVSPIRYLKYGAEMNSVSKATLLLLCNELKNKHDFVYYFPSYEIMMDDLRDYRFYEKDMIHPNEQAIDYIWGKFKDSYFSKDTFKLLETISKIITAKNHKPRNPNSEANKAFIAKQLELIEELKNQYPKIAFTEEEAIFMKRIAEII